MPAACARCSGACPAERPTSAIRRQRRALAKKGVALRAKLGKARAPLDLSGILPRGAPLDLRPLFERFCEEAIGPAVGAAVTEVLKMARMAPFLARRAVSDATQYRACRLASAALRR